VVIGVLTVVVPCVVFVCVVTQWLWAGVAAAIAVGAFIVRLPLNTLADRALVHLVVGGTAPARLRNVAEEIAIGCNLPVASVLVIESPLPNVYALPTSTGMKVAATEAAVTGMTRGELEALVAAQYVVGTNRWVQVASRAQFAATFVWAPLILSFFGAIARGNEKLPVSTIVGGTVAFIVLGVYLFYGIYRWADIAHDLAADSVTAHTTKNPAAMVSAFDKLRPFAETASARPRGAMYLDPFGVVSVRFKGTTSVRANGRVRSWTTADEIDLEFRFRGGRMRHLTNHPGADGGGISAFRRMWSTLGAD
jgi:Zn-dependent protease with chaperone function